MTVFGRLLAYAERLPRVAALFLCLVLFSGVGAIDVLIGSEALFWVFYAAPIVFATWVFGRAGGLLFSAAATIVWTLSDQDASGVAWTDWVLWWNVAVRFAFFAMLVLILAALKHALGEERRLARVDALTGVPNARLFFERAQLELRRAQRTGEPLTVAMLDVDGLKGVNDRHGHAEGDALLDAVAAAWMRALRATDLIARLGGDEFAVLLPDTSAKAALVALQEGRGGTLLAFRDRGWPASLSIGAVTYLGGEADVEGLLRHADALMYEVKSNGKDGVRTAVLGGGDEAPVRSQGSRTGRIVAT